MIRRQHLGTIKVQGNLVADREVNCKPWQELVDTNRKLLLLAEDSLLRLGNNIKWLGLSKSHQLAQ